MKSEFSGRSLEGSEGNFFSQESSFSWFSLLVINL